MQPLQQRFVTDVGRLRERQVTYAGNDHQACAELSSEPLARSKANSAVTIAPDDERRQSGQVAKDLTQPLHIVTPRADDA